EALPQAAAREAAEEAGLSGGIAAEPAGRYSYDKVQSSGGATRCEVRVFPLKVEDVADKWREKRQRKRKWVTPEEASRMVNEPDLAALLRRFGAERQSPRG